MQIPSPTRSILTALLVALANFTAHAADGVFVRFRLRQPAAPFHVKLGGYIHVENWYIPAATFPKGAEGKDGARIAAGAFSEWFDLGAHAGKSLHGRKMRAGGVAEFPNVTAQFLVEPKAAAREVEIELATEPDAAKVVKRWREKFEGDLTSFLVSPNLAGDAAELETAAEMTARRLRWAQEATGGVRHSPKRLILQTQFWSPQRRELNLQEAKVVSLLGFNVVGNMPEEVRAGFPEFRAPAASHDVPLGPETDRAAVGAAWEKLAPQFKGRVQPGAPFNFQDEVCARPPLGTNPGAIRGFHEWLATEKLAPADLGVAKLEEVVPIETPEVLRERMKTKEAAARRIFYYTSRYRQHAATERLLWNSEELHARVGAEAMSSTLVADHPYFGGTGLGMGMQTQNTTWGGWPLAMDWFDVGRRRAVDIIGIEDWLGLQFMYGPGSTWEGFQLLGFQAAIFRSASRGKLPIITWITPSDERNLRLKAASALCQGSVNFFYWCYGPTATSTENYWSDQPGSYPGMAHLSRMLEFAEPVIAEGHPRPTKVALLYSLSSDLWQPFDYIHMLERRGLYFALIHDHYLVDFLTEEDIAAGRLADYRVLYTADPCISARAAERIAKWTSDGGTLVATCAAGSRNEFGEPSSALAATFGIAPEITTDMQPGAYKVRAGLNELAHRDQLKLPDGELGLIGLKVSVRAAAAGVHGTFAKDGAPALLGQKTGSGRAVYFAGTPGISYIKEAKFVPKALAEKWPAAHRQALTRYAAEAGAAPLVRLSEPVVEAGIYDSPAGSALVLANFTYAPIPSLAVEFPTRAPIGTVKSFAHGDLPVATVPAPSPWKEEGYTHLHRFALPLGSDDVVLVSPQK